MQHGLSVRASTEVPLVSMFRPWRSCGATSHTLADCPVLYYSDSNTDHQVDWESYTVRMAWAAVGYTEWQLNLVLPGYEERVQYYPKGSKPYLMCHDNKRAKNSHGSGNYSNTSDGSDRSNQGQGRNSYDNHGNWGGGRDKQRGNQNPNANQNQGRVYGGRGNTTHRRETTLLPTLRQNKTKVRTLPMTTWLPLSTMMSLIQLTVMSKCNHLYLFVKNFYIFLPP